MRCLSFALLALLLIPARAADDATAVSAAELAGRVNAARLGSALIRTKLEVQLPDGGKRTFQLQIKERRTRTATDLVYEVLWPKERKGEAVILHQSGNGAPTGSIVAPDGAVRAIPSSQMDEGIFGSDLSYQDAVENFFAWGDQSLAGREKVNGEDCQILESKPTRSATSSYGKVRSWIDARRFVPMRVEKYSPSGELLRRIDTTRVARDDNRRPIPASLTVTGPVKGSVTEFEGARIDQDVQFTEQDFTPDGVRK
jgi:Outer membrane lipoprotein-sorting protein